MKTSLLLVPAAVLLLAACPGPDSNPSRLWLALNGSEVVIQLVGTEPQPF